MKILHEGTLELEDGTEVDYQCTLYLTGATRGNYSQRAETPEEYHGTPCEIETWDGLQMLSHEPTGPAYRPATEEEEDMVQLQIDQLIPEELWEGYADE